MFVTVDHGFCRRFFATQVLCELLVLAQAVFELKPLLKKKKKKKKKEVIIFLMLYLPRTLVRISRWVSASSFGS
jgi:accessory gene regulator protein AgrB